MLRIMGKKKMNEIRYIITKLTKFRSTNNKVRIIVIITTG
jgi:hypothetical protein